ncbi:MAG: UDP-N-acetylmuramoyl-tripeptide--D-alanyl-D-alanine ligase [Coriobacteriia bacterium]|nr:UDP-N-acetylmuramoyl-tripeptide--D-alanyl-D-alanine ligase [Coriobacteriia bacterium]
MKLTHKQIYQFLQARPQVSAKRPDDPLTSLTWDSREARPAGIFVAIKGEHSDGNEYLPDALAKGASLLIASRPSPPSLLQAVGQAGAGLIEATDPEFVIGEIARLWRGSLAARVVGVTGSSGKTSTKELIASVLGTAYRVTKNQGNYNNLLGLPYTVLECGTEDDFLVLEMGMQQFGEISRYAEISSPEIAVVTNIGLAHLELLGSQEAIAQAKAELLLALPDGKGAAVLNGDDSYTEYLIEYSNLYKRNIEVLKFGFHGENTVSAKNIQFSASGMPRFDLVIGNQAVEGIQMQTPGEHNVKNALAAAAVGCYLSLPPDLIAQGIMETKTLALRSEVIDAGNMQIINDTYNANPDSVRAALKALQQMDVSRPHIAVLGDMLELGPSEQELHRQIGIEALSMGLSLLIAVGSRGAWIAEGARSGNALQGRSQGLPVISVDDWQEAVQLLLGEFDRSPIILVKASRSMGFERIVESLVMKAADSCTDTSGQARDILIRDEGVLKDQ